jgi:hypothetical protein
VSEQNSIEELFRGRHFDREVIILCVRWYLRYKLSFRDLVEMMSERGLHLAHTTILRWVQRYAPSSLSAGIAFRSPLAAPGESMRRIVRPASVSRLKGGALLEHVWNAVPRSRRFTG